MKTILFKIWKFPQLSETFIVNQIVTAINLGYQVEILVGDLIELEGNCDTNLFEKYKLKDKIILEDYKIPSRRWLRFKRACDLLFSNISSWNLLFKYYNVLPRKGLTPLFEFFFYKQFREVETIHVQFGTNKSPVDQLKAIGLLRSKFIISFHGHDVYFPINGKIPNNGYYDYAFKYADHLVCNTPFLVKKLIELNAPTNKIRTIPVAVNTKIFKPSKEKMPENSKIRLITVGRLAFFKGQIWGIKAVDYLIKKGYDIEYIIVGNGDQYDLVQNKIVELKLEKSIQLVGAANQEEVKSLLQTSDIFLMTSITDPNYGVESQGLVSAEAQACGLPIVAFDSGGVKHTLLENETGFLCTEKDINCYAQKIEKLLLNEALRIKMGKKAVDFIVNHYSEISVQSKWKQLYN